jgi:mono/diheme cytochrome c family protein
VCGDVLGPRPTAPLEEAWLGVGGRYCPGITMKHSLLLALGLALPLVVTAADKKPVDTSKIPLPVPRKVDFVKEVYPIFKDACISCHGPEKQKGKYRMDSKEAAFKDTDYGPTVVPGKSAESSLIHMCCNLIDEMMMPPPSDTPGKSEPLTAEQIGILRAWIDQGAEWVAGADSYVKPITFETDIKPIFQAACGECHGATAPKLRQGHHRRRREEKFTHHHRFRPGRRLAADREAQTSAQAD